MTKKNFSAASNTFDGYAELHDRSNRPTTPELLRIEAQNGNFKTPQMPEELNQTDAEWDGKKCEGSDWSEVKPGHSHCCLMLNRGENQPIRVCVIS